MPDGKNPRPTCTETNPSPIDGGTSCLAASPTPTPVGADLNPNLGVQQLSGNGAGIAAHAAAISSATSSSTPPPTAAAEADAAVKALKDACDEAYVYEPAAKSCSHAVWYVLKKLVDKDEPWRGANELLKYMAGSSLWRKVTVDEAGTLANQGTVVVGGKSDTPNGHVIVVYPGKRILGGGYKYTYRNKKTGKDEEATMKSHGLLPPCLSRSIGKWPGGVSKGDKNVFDPWGNDATFKKVEFWTADKPKVVPK